MNSKYSVVRDDGYVLAERDDLDEAITAKIYYEKETGEIMELRENDRIEEEPRMNTKKSTPADAGIQAAREEAQRAKDLENYPTWEKIADTHRRASEARMNKITEQDKEIRLQAQAINDLRAENERLLAENHDLTIENKNT